MTELVKLTEIPRGEVTFGLPEDPVSFQGSQHDLKLVIHGAKPTDNSGANTKWSVVVSYQAGGEQFARQTAMLYKTIGDQFFTVLMFPSQGSNLNFRDVLIEPNPF